MEKSAVFDETRLFQNDAVGTGCFSYLPAEVVWAVTNACNLKCKHCMLDSGKKVPHELTTEEGKRLINDAAKLGAVKFAFTGGEPLMRPDIFELIDYAQSTDVQVCMATNGTLMDDEMARRLSETGLYSFGMSIDGVGKKHDDFRGQEGTFDLAMRGFEAARRAGLRFQFHTTVGKYNIDDMPQLVDLADELEIYRIYLVHLVTIGRGVNEPDIDKEESKWLFDFIIERQKTTNVWLKPICNPQFWIYLKSKMDFDFDITGCTAGITRFHIFPNGDVTPCAYLPVVAGNVREQSFYEIYKNSEVFKNLRERNLKGKCGACEHKAVCGGCRSRANAKLGDYLAEDPLCFVK